jgi:hypothetical protein
MDENLNKAADSATEYPSVNVGTVADAEVTFYKPEPTI